MTINDYLIDQSGHDWAAMLADWNWLLPADFSIWLVNRLGDLFIVLDDGTVYMLDVGAGKFEKLADSQDDFIAKIDEGDNASDWLMIPLVDHCVETGLELSDGQVYSYRTPPILGGEYAVENIEVADLAVHFSVLGQIHRQVKDLPDGTSVSGITVD